MKLPAFLRLPPRWAPYVFLAPFVLLFLIFGMFPLSFSLYLAFQTWEPTSGLTAMNFVGLDNFAFALQDEWFWKSLKNTAWLALASGVPQHLVAIPLACFIHASFKRLRNGVVGAYFMPYITSTVAIAILFSSLFSTDYGLINGVIAALRELPVVGWLMPAAAIDWLNNPDALKPAIAMIVFWRYVGFNVVLYLAALQTIPADIMEAARMDGASRLQQFWHITLPSLKPMIFFGVTLSVIGGLQLFEEPFILTNGRGGTDQAGMTTAIYLYRMAFDFNDFGAASAMSWLLFLLVGLLTWLTNRAFRQRGA
ncbi:sugar ABC transporter permease [Paucibacter sp. TC2R-5]|uniref:carbohydrate ABC transporter permease n=1 Tax=Paucibacter sp. TC2R-5 TaxID=2893555 RepID=UPI0021E36763|nr:sugar ABC transporter permease [Paucibacter sp. TC2R-5]MCV2358671.1 sugar ABC transporter permease [Paucibacter sp. TC2R-5]